VGPSGSGKSSLARCIVAIERPEAGQILYRGTDVLTMSREALKAARREIHLIFQEAAAALNPGFSVEQILSEPLTIHRLAGTQDERRTAIRAALERTELSTELLARRPSELSGGQRQRVAIARALVLQPRLLILDEALSSLDLSTQGQIANLLLDLQEREGLAYLLITHDMTLANRLAHEMTMLSGGRVVQRRAASATVTGNLQGTREPLANDLPSSDTVSGSMVPWGN